MISRRTWIQQTAVAVAGSTLAGCSNDSPPASVVPQSVAFRIVAELSGDFSSQQESLIEESVALLTRQMMDPAIRENMDEISASWNVSLDERSWERSQQDQVDDPRWNEQHEFLDFHLAAMDQKEIRLRLSLFDDESGRWGKAGIGIVQCRYQPDVIGTFDGQFAVDLNNRFLGNTSRWQGTDPRVWAMIFAHEMLHNLGHMHGDRSELTQMIAFERCLYYEGQYSVRLQCPQYECGAYRPQQTG